MGRSTDRSFDKPEPVKPPGPGSTRRAGPRLITMPKSISLVKHEALMEGILVQHGGVIDTFQT
jgi:hypothetical protein